MKAKGTYQQKKWEEATVVQISSTQKIAKAAANYSYLGEIVGTALVEYLIFYRSYDEKDHTRAEADHVGLFFFEGKLNGLAGSFVMRDVGVFEKGAVTSKLIILEASGMGELRGITGTGKYNTTPSEFTIDLDYEINKLR